jgi:hypothetical protein
MKWMRLWPVPKSLPATRNDDSMINLHVIGELRDNPRHLLVHGDDGQYYGYDLATGEISRIDLDASWAVDVDRPVPVLISAPIDSIAS